MNGVCGKDAPLGSSFMFYTLNDMETDTDTIFSAFLLQWYSYKVY